MLGPSRVAQLSYIACVYKYMYEDIIDTYTTCTLPVIAPNALLSNSSCQCILHPEAHVRHLYFPTFHVPNHQCMNTMKIDENSASVRSFSNLGSIKLCTTGPSADAPGHKAPLQFSTVHRPLHVWLASAGRWHPRLEERQQVHPEINVNRCKSMVARIKYGPPIHIYPPCGNI